MAPSGRVPLTGAATSATEPSRKLAACSNKAGREMENALDSVKRDSVVGPRFADAGREGKAKDSAAWFFVGAHGAEQRCGWKPRARRQRAQAADQNDQKRKRV